MSEYSNLFNDHTDQKTLMGKTILILLKNIINQRVLAREKIINFLHLYSGH